MNYEKTWLRLMASCFFAFGIACIAHSQSAAQADTVSFRKANPEKIEGYIVLLRLRYDLFGKWRATGQWPNDKEANKALAAHGEYWAEQLRLGKVLMTGGMKGDYWDNVAMIIMEASSQEEAEQIVANDPAVRTYVFQVQVRPFDMHAISNKYASGQ